MELIINPWPKSKATEQKVKEQLPDYSKKLKEEFFNKNSTCLPAKPKVKMIDTIFNDSANLNIAVKVTF